MAFGQQRQDFIDCDLGQIFQQRRTAGEDLAAFTGGKPLAVTIEGLVVESFEVKGKKEPDVVYELYVRELKKPLKLTKTRMKTIAKLLGTSRTGEWSGRIVLIRAVEDWINDDEDGTRKQIFCIEYVGVAPAAAQMPAKTDITGYALEAARRSNQLPAPGGDVPAGLRNAAPAGPAPAPGTIGEERAAAITQNLYRRDKTWADLEDFLGKSAPQIGRVLAGVMPPAWPQAAVPWIQTYLQGFAPTKPLPSPTELQAIVASWKPAPPPVDVTDPGDRAGAKRVINDDGADIPF